MSRLAVEGGTPVRPRLLPYGRQSVDESDVQAVVEALRSDWLTTGPKVAEFESAFARYTGAPDAVAVNSGTAALHAAVAMLRLAPGDEVVTTPLTFAASANSILYCGGEPRFADVQPDTLNLDVKAVEAAIGPRTRAVTAVDLSGLPVDLDELRDLCRRRNLTLIEDAAHSLGATYRKQGVGSIADLTTFSFHPVKHLTTGEGGMVTSGDADVLARLRQFRNHGIDSDHARRSSENTWLYSITALGYNYRLSDLQCALGLAQLKKQATWLTRRRVIADRYQKAFGAIGPLEVPATLADREHAWHIYLLRLRLDRLRVDRAQVFKALRAENIGVNVHYMPVPWHPLYQARGFKKGSWPVAEAAYERLLTLPLFPTMTDQDVEDVIAAVAKVIAAYQA